MELPAGVPTLATSLATHASTSQLSQSDTAATPGAEPLAIIGMACRFPGGAHSPQQLWHMLSHGVDAVVDVPPERWDAAALYDPNMAAPGKMVSRWGGFLQSDVAGFDAGFFNLSRREAERIDPQQRLLLEVTWEALEHAGQPPEGLHGSPAGVFVGMMNYNEYASLKDLAKVPEETTPYDSVADANSVAAGRVAYLLGVHGPCMSIDTASSSALVALHVAAQSLRAGECSMALVGSVNLMLTSEHMMAFSKSGMMSRSGRCRGFDARGDGYVRAEGCGVLILKRLAQAQADGDRVLAVLRGSAINQDGRSSSLTAPSGPAQEAVLRAALHNAGVRAADVDVVEAHGSGTPVGDPIEMHALHTVLGERQGAAPLVVGSIKTNVGHMEAASGMAGIMKMILALQHGAVPAHLHFEQLNPQIHIDPLRLRVAGRSLEGWPQQHKPRVGGVSSFGFSGTNVHVILQEAPPPPEAPPATEQACVLPLSGRTPEALRGHVRALVQAWPQAPAATLAATAALRRSHYEQRLAVVGRDAVAWREALQAWLDGTPAAGVAHGSVVPAAHHRVVLVFPGQGGQWVGMGRALMAREPVFAETLRACDAAIRKYGNWSLLGVLGGHDEGAQLERIDIVQPALFAVQVATATLLRSWGVLPAAVVGHSMGELAAACIAGALSLDDAAQVMVRRSQLMRTAAGRGAAVAVDLSPEAAEALIAGMPGNLCVAVRNSPNSCAIAGDADAVRALHAQLQGRGAFAALVKADVAPHSAHMEPLVAPLREALADLKPRENTVPMWSTVTGAPLEPGAATAHYWGRNLREPVRFDAAIAGLLAQDLRTFVEISPHPVLTPVLAPLLRQHEDGAVIASLRRDAPERDTLLNAVAQLHTRGVAVNFAALTPPCTPVDLPTYAWQRERCWITPPKRSAVAPRTAPPLQPAAAVPLLAHRWVPLPPAPQLPQGDRSHDVWVLCGGEAGPWAAALERALLGHGCQVVRVPDDADLPACLAQSRSAQAMCRGVVHMRSLEAPALGPHGEGFAQAMVRSCASVVRTVRALTREPWREPPSLVVVTADAQTAGGASTRAVEQTPVWGLARALAYEHPDLRCARVDVTTPGDAASLQAMAEALAASVLGPQPEDELALRPGGQRFGGRLAAVPTLPAAPPRQTPMVRGDATYIITGGLGALGLQVAQALVEQGARHLLLSGRMAPSSQAQALAALQRTPEVQVEMEQADVSQLAAVQRLLARVSEANMPPVAGVIHTAAVLDDGLALEQTPERLLRVLTPKAMGAWHLHSLTQGMPLDFFVMYGSTAALLGAPGQTAFAAANAFLDGLAELRQQAGLPALTISWAPFAETGTDSAAEHRNTRVAQRGMRNLTPDEGQAMLKALLPSGATRMGVAPLNARQWLEFYPKVAASSLFTELRGQADTNPAEGPTTVRMQLQQAPPDERLARLETFLRQQIAAVLRSQPQRIGRTTPLKELGVESLIGVELRNQLEATLGVQLSATLTWAHPTLAALVAFFADLLNLHPPTVAPPAPQAPRPAARPVVVSSYFIPEPSAEALASMTPDELIAALEQEL